MRRITLYVILLMCVVSSLTAQDNMIVPYKTGNLWFYEYEYSYTDFEKGDSERRLDTLSWEVAGSSLFNNRKVVLIEVHNSSGELVERLMLDVNASSLSIVASDYCSAAQSSGNAPQHLRQLVDTELGDKFSSTETACETSDNQPLVDISIDRFERGAMSTIFGNPGRAEVRSYSHYASAHFLVEEYGCMEQYGIMRLDRTKFNQDPGSEEQELHTLIGAVIDGQSYGYTNAVTSVPIPDGSFTSEPSILIFPNPISDSPAFQVSGKSEEFEIQIYDLLGRNLGVFARGVFDEFSSQTVHIDASHLARGSYIAVLVYDDKIQASTLMMK